ncbi:MAG: ABC transporter permease [Nitrospinae bacterium]|nr:ABC transporter permease [Nitrospinota bacterium]
MIRQFVFSVVEAMDGVKSNRGTTLLTIGTITVSIYFMGFFFVSLTNLNNIFNSLKQRSSLVVYLKDNRPEREIKDLESWIAENKDVATMNYISKDDALADFKKEFKWDESVLEGIGHNPLPASFVITLKGGAKNLEAIDGIAADLIKFKGVEDVEYGREWVEQLRSLIAIARLIIVGVGILLALGLLFIVSNTISLSIYSRLDEIKVMKLVGATKRFIRGPFVVEGIIEGIIGSIAAMIFLYGSYLILIFKIPESTIILLGLQEISFLSRATIFWLIASGGLIGLIGAEIAISKVIRIRD